MPFLNFVPVWNQGISFGMLADGGQVVRAGLTLFAFAVVGWFFWQANRLDHVQQIAAGLISGGAIGNAIDRLRFGKVVDFIDVHVQTWHWPAFNVADAAITVEQPCGHTDFLWAGERSGMKSSETNQKPIRRVLQFTMLVVIASGIAACSDFQRAIGSKKSSPDEFEVVVRPPLSLPPGFANTPDDIREKETATGFSDPCRQVTWVGKC